MSEFSERLTKARKSKNMTQEQLARAMGVTRQAVSNWENGRMVPDPAKMEHLFDILEDRAWPEAIAEAAPAAPAPAEPAPQEAKAARKPSWLRWEYLLCFVIGVAVTLSAVYGLVPLLSRPQSEGAVQTVPLAPKKPYDYPLSYYQAADENVAGEAFVAINATEGVPKLTHDTATNDVFLWKVNLFFEELNGVDFTVEEMQYTCFDLAGAVADSQLYTGAEITAFSGSNKIERMRYGFSRAIPAGDYSGLGVLCKGVDANGKEKTFHKYIPLSQEIMEKAVPETYQQSLAPIEGQGFLTLRNNEDSAYLVPNPDFPSGLGWFYGFTIENTGDQDMDVSQINQAVFLENGESDIWVNEVEHVKWAFGGSSVIKPGEIKEYNGGCPKQAFTGTGYGVKARDEKGNERVYYTYIKLLQETAPDDT